MNQINKSDFVHMNTKEIRNKLPFEILNNGLVIAVVTKPDKFIMETTPPEIAKQEDAPVINKPEIETLEIDTQCPNCKLSYKTLKPDNKPGFLSIH